MHCILSLNQLVIACRDVSSIEKSRSAHRILVGKSDGKRSLGRLKRKWEENIKVDMREAGTDSGDWIDLAQKETNGVFI